MAKKALQAAETAGAKPVGPLVRRDRPPQLLARDLADDLPALCGIGDLARVYRVRSSRAYVLLASGEFDKFLIPGAVGPRRWSGVRLQRWLCGEPLDADGAAQPRYFGGGRRRA